MENKQVKQTQEERIIALASKTAIEVYNEKRKAARKKYSDTRFQNTKLLLRNYRTLTDYVKNGIYETAQLAKDGAEELLEIMGVSLSERQKVESIRESVINTKIIMEHVDKMLAVYKNQCLSSSKPEIKRRWRVLSSMYLEDPALSSQDVADKENISVSMVYTDIDSAGMELSTLFFGLDFYKFWM